MAILYNCRHDGDQYRITKMDDDLNPVSSYLCTATECECPAGHRSMCRHREMLPRFIARGAVGNGWWFDFDRGGWVDMRADVEFEPDIVNYQAEPTANLQAMDEFENNEARSASNLIWNEGQLPSGTATAVRKPYRKPNDGRRA